MQKRRTTSFAEQKRLEIRVCLDQNRETLLHRRSWLTQRCDHYFILAQFSHFSNELYPHDVFTSTLKFSESFETSACKKNRGVKCSKKIPFISKPEVVMAFQIILTKLLRVDHYKGGGGFRLISVLKT